VSDGDLREFHQTMLSMVTLNPDSSDAEARFTVLLRRYDQLVDTLNSRYGR